MRYGRNNTVAAGRLVSRSFIDYNAHPFNHRNHNRQEGREGFKILFYGLGYCIRRYPVTYLKGAILVRPIVTMFECLFALQSHARFEIDDFICKTV